MQYPFGDDAQAMACALYEQNRLRLELSEVKAQLAETERDRDEWKNVAAKHLIVQASWMTDLSKKITHEIEFWKRRNEALENKLVEVDRRLVAAIAETAQKETGVEMMAYAMEKLSDKYDEAGARIKQVEQERDALAIELSAARATIREWRESLSAGGTIETKA